MTLNRPKKIELVRTLPSPWYSDPSIFEKERKFIFSNEWIYAADREDLKKPGDYLTFEIAGFPIFMLVGEDHQIRGFQNVCIHRAAPLLTGKKGCLKASTLSCQYHGWTYDLRGSLLTSSLNKNSCELSLFKIQVGFLNHLIFINLNKESKPFLESLQPLKEEVEKSG